MSGNNDNGCKLPDGIDLETILKDLEEQERRHGVAPHAVLAPHLFLAAGLKTKVRFNCHQLRHVVATRFIESLRQRDADERENGRDPQ